MLYVHNTLLLQQAYIPVNGDVPAGALTLRLHGNVSEEDTDVPLFIMRRGRQYLWARWRFAAKMDKGEYRYELRSGDRVLADGLAQIGEYEQRTHEYQSPVTYRQYGAGR